MINILGRCSATWRSRASVVNSQRRLTVRYTLFCGHLMDGRIKCWPRPSVRPSYTATRDMSRYFLLLSVRYSVIADGSQIVHVISAACLLYSALCCLRITVHSCLLASAACCKGGQSFQWETPKLKPSESRRLRPSRPNKAGLNVPSVCPSTKVFREFNEICYADSSLSDTQRYAL